MEFKKTTKSFLSLTDFSMDHINLIFKIADELQSGNKYKHILEGKTIVMFFPENSIRTRISFEKGIYLLGGQTILFSPETLNKKEEIRDVVGYLNNWTDVAVIRHKNMKLIEEMVSFADFSIINAMTDINHPCEILTDLYSLSKIRNNYLQDTYLFVGLKGNIGLEWKEVADEIGLKFIQCCPPGYEIPGTEVLYDLKEAIKRADIVCTDSLPASALNDFKEYQITKEIMDMAKPGALLNPCPPFYRGEEVSQDVIESECFVGYHFKKYLLEIQQALIIYCITGVF